MPGRCRGSSSRAAVPVPTPGSRRSRDGGRWEACGQASEPIIRCRAARGALWVVRRYSKVVTSTKDPMSLYPLIFKPRLLEKIWGGRKIETVLGKSLPPGKQIGESWELYDFPPGVVDKSSDWVSAHVANGPLEGRTIHQLVEEFGDELLGDVKLAPQGQFPILIKFLDACEDLSVQVHPDRDYANTDPDAHLKSEAWYVVENDSGARIYKGLQRGVTRDGFRAAI